MRFPRLNGALLQKGQAQNYTVKVECLFFPRRRAGHRETKFSEGRKVLEEACGVNSEIEGSYFLNCIFFEDFTKKNYISK